MREGLHKCKFSHTNVCLNACRDQLRSARPVYHAFIRGAGAHWMSGGRAAASTARAKRCAMTWSGARRSAWTQMTPAGKPPADRAVMSYLAPLCCSLLKGSATQRTQGELCALARTSGTHAAEHMAWPHLDAALGAAAPDGLVVNLVAHGHLIGLGCGPGLWRVQVGQRQAHQVGQDQGQANVVGNAHPDPQPASPHMVMGWLLRCTEWHWIFISVLFLPEDACALR